MTELTQDRLPADPGLTTTPPGDLQQPTDISPDPILRDAQRAGRRAAQAAYRGAYRRELRLAKARAPERAFPGPLPDGPFGALTEAYHRWYDSARAGVCSGRCRMAAAQMLAFMPGPWRLTADPTIVNRDAYTSWRHGIPDELSALLPAPWRIVANAIIPRSMVLDERLIRELLWAERFSRLLSRHTDAPGESPDDAARQEAMRAEIHKAAAAGRKPDLRAEGPTMSVRQFTLSLWRRAKVAHPGSVEDGFMIELRRLLADLRANPHDRQ